MEGEALTNRELAALLLLGILIAFVLVHSKRANTAGSIGDLLKSLIRPLILIPLLLYAGWISTVVFGASELGFWESHLLKATILWFLLSGIALVFRLNDAIQKPGFFREALTKALGVAGLTEFLVSLRSFPLWIEIPGQALAFLFAGIVVVARDPSQAQVRKLANGYLALFGICALVWSTAHLVSQWPDLDHARFLREFLLPIWLTPFALLFVYGFAVVVAYQSLFKRMRIWNRDGSLIRQRLAVLLRANLRLGTLRLTSGLGAQRVARTGTFRDAWKEIRQLRDAQRRRVDEEAAALRRLVENAGLQGTDDNGRQLDQREFDETRKALMWLATCHMGHYRNGEQRYRSDLLPIVESHFSSDGLPENHGVEMYVEPEGQRWYATRQTISGWWFGIGAAGPPPDQWLYDGPRPPQDYPSEPEWDRFGGGNSSVNWD